MTFNCSTMCRDYFKLLLFLVAYLVTVKGTVIVNELDDAATDFSKYRTTYPTFYHARTKREISTTRNADGGHHFSVTLTVPTNGEELVLDLELNEDLVPRDHTLQYKDKGLTVIYKPKKEDLDLCHYHGSVRGKSYSWAAVSTCHGVSGVIFDGTKMRYIEPARDSDAHFLYDHNDLNTTHPYGNQVFNNNHGAIELSAKHERDSKNNRAKRNIKKLRYKSRFTKKTRYVELVLVADHRMYRKKRSTKAVHSFLIKIANIVNSIYSPLNIKIALVGVVVWSEGDEAKMDSDSHNTLVNLIDYRGKYLYKIKHDHAQLLTGKKFHKNVIGRAYSDVICKDAEYSGSITSYFSSVLGRLAANSAHELGHSLGINNHDEVTCECPTKHCVMDSTNDAGYKTWSYCSKQDLDLSFMQGGHNCLLNKPKHVYNSL